MAGQVTRFPLEVAAEWVSKTVTTDPPRLTPHDEWSLVVVLRADAPFRLVSLHRSPRELYWRLRPGAPSTEIDARVLFVPRDWSKSDLVHVDRWLVSDEAMKLDPRAHVIVAAPKTATTGDVIPLCEVPRHRIEVAALALAAEDTEDRREHRWRVRPRLAHELPNGLEQLASGHQSRTLRLNG